MPRGLIRVFSKDLLDDRGEDALLIFGVPDVAHAPEVVHSSRRSKHSPRSFAEAVRLGGPNSSFGSVKRVSR